MIWMLLPFGFVAILVAGILVSDALAQGFTRISMARGRGEETKEPGLKGSESFTLMEDHGKMGLLSPEEARVMNKLNPKLLE